MPNEAPAGSEQAAAERIAAKNIFGLGQPATAQEDTAPASEPVDGLSLGEADLDEAPSADDADFDSQTLEAEDASPDPAETGGDELETEEAIETFGELAENLGVDLDDLLDLTFQKKVNGEVSAVSARDLLKVDQLESQVNQRSSELGRQRVKLEEQFAAKEAEVDKVLAQGRQMLELAKQEMLGELSAANIEELAKTDPAQAQTLWMQMQMRVAGLDKKIAEHNAQVQARQAEQQQRYQQQVLAEQRRLPEVIPEWNDPTVAKRELGEMEQFLLSRGVPQERMPQITSATELQIIREAWLYSQVKQNAGKLTKKVRKAPKGLRAGARQAGNGAGLTGVGKARVALRKSGTEADAAAMIAAKRKARGRKKAVRR